VEARKLTFRRTFSAPPEKVFRAFVTGDALKEWWSPDGYVAIEASVDARPGGAYRIVMRSQAGGETVSVRGIYREVSPPHRLVFTHSFEGRGDSAPFGRAGLVGHETLVTVQLTARGDKTVMVLVQERIPSADAETMLRSGWSGILDKLGRHVAQRGGRAAHPA
jgi:uncharacterized protein YndB with AHSA1/START domain